MNSDINTSVENAVLSRWFEACTQSGKTEELTVPPSVAVNASKSPAHWVYERLILYIRNFEETLDAEHEVAMGFAVGRRRYFVDRRHRIF